MKFMYLGEGSTTIFGHTFKAGEPEEVTDERAIGKLKASVLFAHDEEPAPGPQGPTGPIGPDPRSIIDGTTKRRGRPPNATQ